MRKPIRRALISVYDKTRLIEVGSALNAAGVEILSTGSTAKNLADAGIPVIEVSHYTGFPEIMGGRVKTLHPRVHGGILADQNNPEHLAAIADLDIAPFDLVIINLYPFAATIASGANFEECIEQIDIGGPSMLRGAAKNHGSVAVISHPAQYDQLIAAISAGGFTEPERRHLALEVFRTTAQYDLAIANWLGESEGKELPDWFGQIWSRKSSLRYGENPHQKGFFYGDFDKMFTKVHGKELSYNNLLDVDAAVNLMNEFKNDNPTFAILKHNNACGLATRNTMKEAYLDALAGDPTSAFGGVLIANGKIDVATANEINQLFCEVVIAPAYDQEAIDILEEKKNRIILIQNEVEFYLLI